MGEAVPQPRYSSCMKWDGAYSSGPSGSGGQRASTSTPYQAGVAGSNIEKRIVVARSAGSGSSR